MSTLETPYWWATAPELAIPAEPLPARVDVAIVGGGYTGLAAARRLARAGVRVAVLEQETIGWGASSRNGGQVLTGLTLDAEILVRRFGLSRARELFSWSLDAIDALERLVAEEEIECELARCGHLAAAAKPAHLDALAREQELLASAFGYETELVPRERSAGEIGTMAYHGLLVDRGSARLHPAKYVRGLARAARRAGAALHERAKVECIERDGAGVVVHTTRGRLTAGQVLVATNAYSGSAVPALRQRLMSVGSYLIATEPLPESMACRVLPTHRVVFDTKFLLNYFHLAPDRRLIFGGRTSFAAPSARTLRTSAARLRRDLTQLFPELAGIGVDYVWGGQVAIARDRIPHAGRLGPVHYVAGYGGHGIAVGTVLGDRMGRWLLGEQELGGDAVFFEEPFRPFPFAAARGWMLPAIGLWYRARDLVG